MRQRPLSPHLQIYKWQLTSVLSILHRMTGIALSFGLVFLTLWFAGSAFSPALFDLMRIISISWLGKIALLGWTWAAFYHLANGIRHLLWDFGQGYELKTVYRTGWAVVISATFLTAGSWWYAACPAKPCWSQNCPQKSAQADAPTNPQADLPDNVIPHIPKGGRP